MKLFSRYKLHHILIWLVYFIFWTSLSVYQYHTPFPYALLSTFIWFTGHATLVYACIYWLIPVFLAARRYTRFMLLLLLILPVGAAFIAGTAGALFRHITPAFNLSFGIFFFYILINNFCIAGLSIAAGLIRERFKNERRNRRIEKDRTENELRFLKSQVNPHFLFNAINSIYVLIKKDPNTAAATLAQFADMLRYQLYECNVDGIPIEKELAYLENYVNLEKLRKNQRTAIVFSVAEQVRYFSIAPLLLIPFVENAFKHVAPVKDGAASIRVDMQYIGDVFRLEVENTMDASVKPAGENNYGGIGLENVRRRLELIYPGRHTLHMNTVNCVYSVALQIKIPV